jgi:hypothetical protein
MKVGDLVCHTTKFLRDTSWFTNVPVDGVVTNINEDLTIASVDWNDGTSSRLSISCLRRLPGKVYHPTLR